MKFLQSLKYQAEKQLRGILRGLPFYSKRSLILSNLLDTHRLRARFAHKRYFRFKPSPFLESCDTNILFDHSNPTESFALAELSLRTNGAVVLEGYFNADRVASFSAHYEQAISSLTEGESRFGSVLKFSPSLIDFWIDPALLQFISGYMGESVYCRSLPKLQYVDRQSTWDYRLSKAGVAYPWHIDHCSILVKMVYLRDIQHNGTAMEIVAGSHHLPLTTWSQVEDTHVKLSRLPIKRLFGPVGSVQIHDPNVIHRASPVLGSDRLWLYSDFSWGENILFDIHQLIQAMADSSLAFSELEAIQTSALSGLFPQMPMKGFQIDPDGFISPQLRQSI